jgi:hypothetical protein
MTRQIKTDIQINATPEKVWQTLGVPFFGKMIDVNTTNGFHQMNQQLKLLAEK